MSQAYLLFADVMPVVESLCCTSTVTSFVCCLISLSQFLHYWCYEEDPATTTFRMVLRSLIALASAST